MIVSIIGIVHFITVIKEVIMPLLDGIKCPVCGVEFAEGDDVVYCPDCGTPHHRECYKMAGHCVNAGLHKTGYNFYDENIKKPEKAEKPAESAPNNTTPEGFYIPKQEQKQTEGETPFSPFMPAQATPVGKEYEGQTIDGTPAKDIAAAVRSNTNRFMPLFKRFETGKKTGWNWGAFLFGPYYLLFRKMYAQGIGLLCLQGAISYLGSYFMATKAPKFTETMQSIMTSSKGAVSQLDMEALQATGDFAVATKISVIMFAVLLVIRIVTALFADRLYYGMIKNLVKDVNEKISEGASFSAVPTMMNAPQQELDGEQMKLLYLARRGGTSMFAALLGYLALSVIQML